MFYKEGACYIIVKKYGSASSVDTSAYTGRLVVLIQHTVIGVGCPIQLKIYADRYGSVGMSRFHALHVEGARMLSHCNTRVDCLNCHYCYLTSAACGGFGIGEIFCSKLAVHPDEGKLFGHIPVWVVSRLPIFYNFRHCPYARRKIDVVQS
jgi:hypothetical protein